MVIDARQKKQTLAGKIQPGRQHNLKQKKFKLQDLISSCLLSRPVVEIVSNVMTLTTFRETLVHAFSVRQTVAISTLRNCHVLVSVTGSARDLAVFGLARSKSCKSRIMARGTELGLSRCRISQTKWFVGL